MVLVVVRFDEAPVDLVGLSISHGDKVEQCHFRIGSEMEHYFFRVRQLNGVIMRYISPDVYFLPIMRDIVIKHSTKRTQKWGDEDSYEDVTLQNVAQLVRAGAVQVLPAVAVVLKSIWLNYTNSKAKWELYQCRHGNICQTSYTESYCDNTDTESHEHEHSAFGVGT